MISGFVLLLGHRASKSGMTNIHLDLLKIFILEAIGGRKTSERESNRTVAHGPYAREVVILNGPKKPEQNLAALINL